VKDSFLVQHMHLKDYSGGREYLGYCPLGQGKVDIPAILAMMDAADGWPGHGGIDSPPPQPAPRGKRADREGLSGRRPGVSFRA